MASPYGPNIDDAGEINYLSPSAHQTGDPASGGCPRKYYYEYREKKKQPETKAQATGTALHAEVERHLLTGSRDLGSLAMSGLHMLPKVPPHDDLGVEVAMSPAYTDPEHAFAVQEAKAMRLAGDVVGAERMLGAVGILTSCGVPFVGRIDLLHARGVNQGTEDPDDAVDPPGTVEVHDHKTSSDVARYVKTPEQLRRSTQMLAYARWVVLEAGRLGLPGSAGAPLARVRVSHGYYQTRGRSVARKVSALMTVAEVVEGWERVRPATLAIVEAARAASADDVEPNLDACDSYGGCPHRRYCKAGMSAGFRGFFPKSAGNTPPAAGVSGTEETKMGFLDKLREKDKARNANPIDQKVIDAWRAIAANAASKLPNSDEQFGRPALGGEAAKAVHAIEGRSGDCPTGIAGSGALGGATLSTTEEIVSLAAELGAMAPSEPAAKEPAAKAEPTLPPLVPDDVPKSDPARASAGPEGKDPTKNEKPAKKPKTAAAPAAPPTGGVAIFVGVHTSFQTERLEPWVQRIMDELAADGSKELGIEIADVRACDAKPFGFGGWKGLVDAAARRVELPAGSYSLCDPAGDEVLQIVCRALRARAAMFVWR